MKKNIQKQFMVVTTLAIASTLFLISILCYDLFRAQIFEELKTFAHVVLYTKGNDVEGIEQLAIDYNKEPDGNIRITLIDKNGVVLVDNRADISDMENHGDREEVMEAWESGTGVSVRTSDTIQKASYYVAVKLDDNLVLRVSTNSNSIYGIFLKAIPLVIVVVVLLWILCMLLANYLTTSIIKPIKDMAEDIGDRNTVQTYDELRPIMETIRKQHEDILQSAKMRQEFTANVSHELKTPLTSISGYSELIEAGMANEKDTRHFAAEIHKNANRLLSLINDTLELSKLDTSSGEMQMEPVNVYELAVTCAAMLELNAAKRGITIRVEGTDAYILGSRQMIEEVVYNLCDNAIRYNKDNGQVILSVQDKIDTVIFKVKDTGIGIPKEHQARVFERFYRVDKSRSKSTGGTGLGLAIVKHIVATHGATLELESEVNVGSTITVTFLKYIRQEFSSTETD